MSDHPVHGVLHIVGLDVYVGGRLRQRCAWCGALLVDDDLTGMAWALNADGTDPGPPGAWPVGAVVAVSGGLNEPGHAVSMRSMHVVPIEEWPDATEPGEKALPLGCCARLDPDVTR